MPRFHAVARALPLALVAREVFYEAFRRISPDPLDLRRQRF